MRLKTIICLSFLLSFICSNQLFGKDLLITCDYGDIIACSSLAQIDAVVDIVVNTKPDIFVLDIASPDAVHYPSKHARHYLAPSHKMLVEQGHDPYGYFTGKLREAGITVIANVRMNDHHCGNNEMLEWQRDIIEHSLGKEKKDIKHWHDGVMLCQMDYAALPVREHRLATIKEFLTRYNLDGVQLDFGRTLPFVSEPRRENAKYITLYLEEVRQLLDAAARHHNRPTPGALGVVVPWDIEFCLDNGLDVKTWAHEGLVDYITAGEWYYTEFNMPIAQWVKLLSETTVKFYPMFLGDTAPPRHLNTTSWQKGDVTLLENGHWLTASNISALAELSYSQGADGVHLYNFYIVRFGHLYSRLRQLTAPESIAQLPRHYFYCRGVPKYMGSVAEAFMQGSNFQRWKLDKTQDKIEFQFSIGTDPRQQGILFRYKMKNATSNDVTKTTMNGVEIKPVHIDRFNYTNSPLEDKQETYAVSVWQTVLGFPPLAKGENTVTVELVSRDADRSEKIEVGEFELMVR